MQKVLKKQGWKTESSCCFHSSHLHSHSYFRSRILCHQKM